MNHWQFIIAAYAISGLCMAAVFAATAFLMVRAERRVEKL